MKYTLLCESKFSNGMIVSIEKCVTLLCTIRHPSGSIANDPVRHVMTMLDMPMTTLDMLMTLLDMLMTLLDMLMTTLDMLMTTLDMLMTMLDMPMTTLDMLMTL